MGPSKEGGARRRKPALRQQFVKDRQPHPVFLTAKASADPIRSLLGIYWHERTKIQGRKKTFTAFGIRIRNMKSPTHLMGSITYLDLPLFPLADTIRAGVKTLCATNGSTPNFTAIAMPDPAHRAACSLALRQADEARADFAAIDSNLQSIMGQLAQQPSRSWVTRMRVIGFGSAWALLSGVALMLAR
jgi:hypothetical protein